jgi:hypothetical protein
LFSKLGEAFSKEMGTKFQGKGSKIQSFSFHESRLFSQLGRLLGEPRLRRMGGVAIF